MKLVKIDPLPEFYYTCLTCKGRFSSRSGYADLDGEPYKAYYCTRCGNIKKENRKQNSNLGCDVELGGIGTNLKSVSTIMMIGGVGYLLYRFNFFGGLKWLTDAFKDLVAAPKTIAIFEDEQLNVRGSQIEKMFNILRQKADNFTTQYGKLYDEWLKLKGEIKTGAESYSKTFYESGKMQYFGSKSSKEKMMDRLDSFRTKVLIEVRNLQNRKNFKINSRWEIIGCIPCLF